MSRAQKHASKSHSNAIVVGLGKNGVACAGYLIDEGWDVEIADVKPHPQLERLAESELPGIVIHTEIYPHLFVNADLVVMSRPSTGPYQEALDLATQSGCRTVTSLELFFKRSEKPVVAIVGTNGKSTVLALVQAIAKKQGETACIDAKNGYPFFDLLDDKQPDTYILELTAQQLSQIQSVGPSLVAILNQPIEAVQSNGCASCTDTTTRVLENAEVSVINRDDPVFSQLTLPENSISYGRSAPARDCDYGIVEKGMRRWVVRGEQHVVDLNKCALKGIHNELNILAACAVAEAAGYSAKSSQHAIKNFAGLPFSCEDEGEMNGIHWVNDARSTNVDAAIAAIESSDKPAVLIAGGLSQGEDFSRIPTQVNGKLRGCVLFGRDGKKIGEHFEDVNIMEHVDDIDDAIAVAERIASEGDRVVFSPACVSHDMFTDYQQRGESFSQALRSHFDGSSSSNTN